MGAELTAASIRWAVARVSERMGRSVSELNELDAALGDGDLGVTMARAAAGLAEDLPRLPEDIGLALLRCAQTVSRASAGTYGTLLATGLMAAAKATKGRGAVPWAELPRLLESARSAISDRSHGQLGDKTVLDALEAARRAIDGLDNPPAMLGAAVREIGAAIQRFRDLPFRQGRARIFGAKGIGKDDPGMIAFQRMVECLVNGECVT